MDRSKGIKGSNRESHSPIQGKTSINTTGKAGSKQVNSTAGKKHITKKNGQPPNLETSIRSRTHNHEYDFSAVHKKIDECSDLAEAVALYDGMVKRQPSAEQLKSLNSLMKAKGSELVAETYLRNLQASGDSVHDFTDRCTVEALKQKIGYLKTVAGRMARFIDPVSVHKSLQHMINDALATGEMEYGLEQAIAVTATGGAEFDHFIATNRNLLLFANLLTARVSQGIPAEESSNQRIFSQLQIFAAQEVSQQLFSKLQADHGDITGLAECLILTRMTEDKLKNQLTQEHRDTLIEALGFDFDDDMLHRYMSMEVLKSELKLYIDIHRENLTGAGI